MLGRVNIESFSSLNNFAGERVDLHDALHFIPKNSILSAISS